MFCGYDHAMPRDHFHNTEPVRTSLYTPVGITEARD
jgi:hypothetical protein